MINYKKVFEAYPKHQIMSIESCWIPDKGFMPWREIYDTQTAALSIAAIIEISQKMGARTVQLILKNKVTGNTFSADFPIRELLK